MTAAAADVTHQVAARSRSAMAFVPSGPVKREEMDGVVSVAMPPACRRLPAAQGGKGPRSGRACSSTDRWDVTWLSPGAWPVNRIRLPRAPPPGPPGGAAPVVGRRSSLWPPARVAAMSAHPNAVRRSLAPSAFGRTLWHLCIGHRLDPFDACVGEVETVRSVLTDPPGSRGHRNVHSRNVVEDCSAQRVPVVGDGPGGLRSNIAGEPCAGEPHARFDGRGLETERVSVTAPAPDPSILQFRPARLLVERHRGCETQSRFGGSTHL